MDYIIISYISPVLGVKSAVGSGGKKITEFILCNLTQSDVPLVLCELCLCALQTSSVGGDLLQSAPLEYVHYFFLL